MRSRERKLELGCSVELDSFFKAALKEIYKTVGHLSEQRNP